MSANELERLKAFEVPGLVTFDSGSGGLTRAIIKTDWSSAELYLHGAQVTGFQKEGDSPLLFLSKQSRFAPGIAIRGGIPICLPWFGPRPGAPAHGFARIMDWEVSKVAAVAGGGAALHLKLPQAPRPIEWAPFEAEFVVTLTSSLLLELRVANPIGNPTLELEACLHTYFAVGDIGQITITGLDGAAYIDLLENRARKVQPPGPMRIMAQTDRTYPGHTGVVEIHDPVFGRTIRVAKTGSASSVVWNPWTTQVLSDLSAEEYRGMLCVESGNVGENRISLSAGANATVRVELSSRRASHPSAAG